MPLWLDLLLSISENQYYYYSITVAKPNTISIFYDTLPINIYPMKHLSLHHNFFFITLPYLSWHLRFEPIENPYRPSAISNSIRLFIILLLRSIVENNLKTIHAKMDTGNRIVRDGYANPEHQKAVPLFFSIYILCLSAKPIFNSA